MSDCERWCNCPEHGERRRAGEVWRQNGSEPPFVAKSGVSYRHRCPWCKRPRNEPGPCFPCAERENRDPEPADLSEPQWEFDSPFRMP